MINRCKDICKRDCVGREKEMKEIMKEGSFVILKGKYLLGRQEMGKLPK